MTVQTQTENVLMVTEGSAYAELLETIDSQRKKIELLNKEIDIQIMDKLNASIKHENLMKAAQIHAGETELKATLVMTFLSKFCDEFEGRFDSDEDVYKVFGSIEFALDYLAAAKYLETNHGRSNGANSTYERIAKAVDQYVPWNKSPVSSITNEVK